MKVEAVICPTRSRETLKYKDMCGVIGVRTPNSYVLNLSFPRLVQARMSQSRLVRQSGLEAATKYIGFNT